MKLLQPKPVRAVETARGRKVSQDSEAEKGNTQRAVPNAIGIQLPRLTFSGSNVRRSSEEVLSF